MEHNLFKEYRQSHMFLNEVYFGQILYIPRSIGWPVGGQGQGKWLLFYTNQGLGDIMVVTVFYKYRC